MPGDDEAISRAAAALRDGALVVLPTDTVYGVGGHAALPGVCDQLYAAKKRPADKPLPLLISGPEALASVTDTLAPVERALAERLWPGPLTLILRTPDDSEGVRVPDCEVARRVIAAAGGVLRVTSANVSGEPPSTTAPQAAAALGNSVAVVLDNGPSPVGRPSTVARLEGGHLRIPRHGAISRELLHELCQPYGVSVDEQG